MKSIMEDTILNLEQRQKVHKPHRSQNGCEDFEES